MKRHILTLSVVLWSAAMIAAEIPTDYYAAIQGTQDSVLKSTLSLIVRGGTRYEYGITTYHSSDNPPEWHAGDIKALGTWHAMPFTDILPGNQVWDMYSNSIRYYPNRLGDSGCSLNIEHCLPKSWWGWNDKLPADNPAWIAYKDLYNLNPSDQRANSQKNNYAPGHVQKGDKFDNGSFRMDSKAKSLYNYICWEPAEEYRGDFARAYFYMATAYEYLEWTAYPEYISGSSYLMFSDAIQQVLLDWHRADPVSDKECCRMDYISDIQGNRNPFIDYPELVEYIWGDKQGQPVDLASLDEAFHTGTCIAEEPSPEPEHIYDTIISLPAITAAYIKEIPGGQANSGIQSNGNASITMGKGSTDGEISFSDIQLSDSAILAFRASPYNSATSMQLDVYADEQLLQSIQVSVVQETRHEVRYRLTVPQETTSLRFVSVGGSTSQRACMQELYLLTLKKDPTAIPMNANEAEVRKQLRNGQLVIIRNASIYTTLGQKIR